MDFLHEFPNVGMSISPGRNRGKYFRDLSSDLRTIKEEHNIDVIVTMLSHEDLSGMSILGRLEKFYSLFRLPRESQRERNRVDSYSRQGQMDTKFYC